MWKPHSPTKADLQGHKTIKISGSRYVIRKINPLLDFDVDNMPQIFSYHLLYRGKTPPMNDQQKKKTQDDMKMIVQAGLISPHLVSMGKGDLRGKEDGITVDDLFRDLDMGLRLYVEIMSHSLSVFKGSKGVFFSIKQKLLLFIGWPKFIQDLRSKYFTQQPSTP